MPIRCSLSLNTHIPHTHMHMWKILKEMGLPDHMTCLLRNLYAGQKATIRTGHGTTDWFQIGKGVCQGCMLSHFSRVQLWATPQMAAHQAYCHLVYLTYMQSTSREMLGWMNHKLESRLPGEISIISDTQMTRTLW